MRSSKSIVILAVLLVTAVAQASASVWVSAPKPKFPQEALSTGHEGYVIVRAYVARDGSVTRATISKSSGDKTLDDAARTAVSKWKMNAASIKPEYLTKGYDQRIDFQQEAPVVAHYRDRSAFFSTYSSAAMWTYAPFPEYPFHERLLKSEGVSYVKVELGPQAQVASATLAKSSGYPNLDKAAVAAVGKWRAHQRYARQRYVVPVIFTLHGYRRH